MSIFKDLDPERRRMLVLAARRFYLEDRSKIEIGEELGLSRFKVARLLAEARETGIVTITLHDQGTVDQILSAQLAEHLGLQEATVIEASGNADEIRGYVGEAAAELLSRTLRRGEVLGLAWGRTLTAMTESLPALPRVSVVQLTGAIGSDLDQSPVEIVRKVALSSGGSAFPIFAPLLVEDPATAAALRRQPDLAKALDLMDKVTTAVVSIGSWDPAASQMLPAVTAEERAVLTARGVRADLAAILVDDDGNVVTSPVTERTVAVTPDQMRRIPRILAVAGGAEKGLAVIAAARAQLITGLVTDRALAETVLATRPIRTGESRGA